jgi:hypothetical protein
MTTAQMEAILDDGKGGKGKRKSFPSLQAAREFMSSMGG